MTTKLTIHWGEADKATEQRKRWLGSWLVSRDGEEGDNFYEGSGGVETTHDIPSEALGFRLRWWPPDNQVELNLEFGPLPTLTEDYFFSGAEHIVTASAMDLVK